MKKSNAAEADAFYIIYTKDFGKIRARAQGVKKEGAKLKGHLEVLSHSSVSFVLGKNGERLTQAQIINSWPEIRSDLDKIKTAQHLIELVDRNCLEGEKDEPLWKLLLESLIFLEKNDLGEEKLELLENEFEKRLSSCLGYGSSGEVFKKVR